MNLINLVGQKNFEVSDLVKKLIKTYEFFFWNFKRYKTLLKMSNFDSLLLALITTAYSEDKWTAGQFYDPVIHTLKRVFEGKEFVLRIAIDDAKLKIIYKCSEGYQMLWTNIWDVFLKKEYDLVENFTPTVKDLVVDVGAHVGLYTLKAARVAKTVIAFEPVPKNFYYLMRHVKYNDLRNVIALPLALGNHEGKAVFYLTGWGLGGSTMFENHLKIVKNYWPIEGKVTAKMTTLNKVIQKLGFETIDLLKIDAEGAERLILFGSRQLLKKGAVKKLVVEVHKTVNEIEEIINFLRKYEYTINAIFDEGTEKALIYASLPE